MLVKHNGIDTLPKGNVVPNRDPVIVIAVVVDVLHTDGATPVTIAATDRDEAEYAMLPTPAGVCTLIVPDVAFVTHCSSLFACKSIEYPGNQMRIKATGKQYRFKSRQGI